MMIDTSSDSLRPHVDQGEPFTEHGAVNGPSTVADGCTRCGHVNLDTAESCAKCGCFLKRNQKARQTGVYAQPANQPLDLRQNAEQLIAGIVGDCGGIDELTTIERAYIQNLADVQTTMRLLINDLVTRGFLTAAGNPRRSYELYLSAVDRFDRLGQRIGTKRRAKPVRMPWEAQAIP